MNQEYPKNPIFFKNGKNHPKCKNSKTSRDMPKLARRPYQRSLIHWEAWFPPGFVSKFSQKKTIFFYAAILGNFQTKMFKSETTCFHYLSPRIGHPTSGSGGKKTFKQYLKSEHTDRQTNRRTDRRTFWLIESIGPEGRCFENIVLVCKQKKKV